MNNYEWLIDMGFHSVGLKSLIDKKGKQLLTENGFEMVKSELGLTEIYNLMAIVSKQRVIPVVFKDIAAELGIMERIDMEYGTAIQENYVGDIESGSSPETFAKTGDVIDYNTVALPTITQYLMKVSNKDFFAAYTEDGRALKQAWLKYDDGLDTLVGSMTAQVLRAKAKKEFAWIREAIDFAINDTEHFPLQDTQKITLTSWTASAPTDDQITELIGITKDVAEAMDDVVDCTTLNAAGITGSMDKSKLKMYVRKGLRKRVDKLQAYTYHDGKLDFVLPIKSLPDFGGVKPADSNNNELQPVYVGAPTNVNGKLIPKDGVIGYVDAGVTVNGYAKYVNNQWLVNVTSGSTTADTTFIVGDAPNEIDPNANVVAIIAEDGLIRELVEQGLQSHTHPLYGTNFVQREFFQNGNAIHVVAYKDLVVIYAPSANNEVGD